MLRSQHPQSTQGQVPAPSLQQLGQPAYPPLRPSYNLWIHDPGFSKQDLVINPDCFPGCRVGDLLKITQPASSGDNKNGFSQSQFPSSRGGLAALSVRQHSNPNQHHRGVAHGSQAAEDKSRTLILQVTSVDREFINKQSQLQISIAQHIAAIFELHARKDVVVTKVEREAISADYVEICFRDQYLGRSDMWRMKTSLTGTCVYEGKKVSSLGIRAQIKDIVVSGRKASCGYINDNTKTIFRSETAKYFICIQMSKEMWEFDEDGELYFEKCVHGFLPQLFAKWKEAGANHVVSVVLFARIHYQTDEEEVVEDTGDQAPLFTPAPEGGGAEDGIPLLKDASGRSYRDFYKVVVDWAIRSDWSQILIPLEKEFVSFQRDVLQQSSSEGSTILAGTNSPASEGNVLEAINLALNPFDRHYIDRDLSRTGLGIVVITPGPGVYEVDKKLLRLTAHRMVDNGIGLDLVCLSKPPLCTVPLFQYVSKECPSSLTGWGSGQSGASIDAESSINSERRWASALGGATGQKGPERSADKMGTGASDRSMGTHAAPGFSSASGTSGQERRTEAWDPLYYDDATPEIPDKTFYTVPHWIMCSFWAREGEQDNKGFRLRCKMYEVQMMGVMEEIGSTIVIPYMEEQDLAEVGDVQVVQVSSKKQSDAQQQPPAPVERNASGVVRFDVGGDDDENSPAVSVIDDFVIDTEQYDESVFLPIIKHQSMVIKNRSNSGMNVGGSSDVDSLASNKGVRGGSRLDLQHPYATTGGARGNFLGNVVSISPEGVAGVVALGPQARQSLHRMTLNTTDSVRSDDSGGGPTRNLYQNSGYYPTWEEGDTLRSNDRIALIKAKARIEQVRAAGGVLGRDPSQISINSQPSLRGTTSDTALSSMFAGGGSQQRVLAKTASNTSLTAEAAATAEKKRPAWASSAAQSSGGRTSAPVSRKSSVLASDTAYGDSHTLWSGAGTSPGKGDVRLSQPSRTEDARASVPQSLPIGANLQRAAIEDTDSSGLHSASTTLAPIRIRGNQQVGLRHPYREGLSTSGSFKSHSPLANYEYLRSQYPRVSPGKTSGSGGNMRAPTFQQTSFRSHLINPCNPSRNIIRATSQVLRWQHVFPQIILPMRNDFIIAWKSLSIPACLPLTTDFFPSPEDLQQLYQEYTYTVSAADDATPYQSRGTGRSDEGRGTQTTKVEGLLVDLVAQRLAQGFQLIIAGSTNLGLPGTPLGERGGDVPQQATNIGGFSSQPGSLRQTGDKPSNPWKSSAWNDTSQRSTAQTQVQGRSGMQQAVHKDRSPSFGASTTPGTRASPRAYYLSLGDHVHKLSHDASGQNVEVKRYVRKVTYSTLPIQYACGIWRKHDTFYRPKQLGFSYPPVTSYNWNYLDHLISGYQEELTENLRFWRTRFLLIPVENVNHVNPFLNPQNDNLDEEEIRVVGFEKFIEVFEKSRWVPPWEEDDVDFPPQNQLSGGSRRKHIPKLGKKLQIQLTTLNTSRFIREEVLRRGLTRMGTAGTNPGGASTANQKALPTTLPRRGSATSPATSVNGTNTVSPTPLTRSSPFSAVAEAMQAPPPAGVAFGDRRWHFRLYERVFIGSECVEWMVRNFADIETPEEAVAYGNALLKEGFFEHANRKHRFLDGHYFYRVRGDFAKTPGTAGTKDKEKEKLGGVPLWFGNRAKSSTNLFDSNSGSSSPSVTTSSNTSAYPSNDALAPTSTNALDMAVQDSPQAAQTKSVRQAVEPYALTRRMVIDLDVQRRSPRRETAVLHYDTVHNPRHCYHYQIHWLACSPRWIEDLVAGWARVAEKCGFKMVEAGTSQAEPLSDDNPFQSVTLIKPCIPLPLHPKAPFPSSVYLTETVRRFNFVLDMEADSSLPTNAVTWSYDRGKGFKRTQWVHRSGVAFIQISSEDEEVGFWWVANRMHLTGSASVSQQGGAGKEARGSSSSGVDPDTLMKTFADFCNNEAEIRQFWDEVYETFSGIYEAATAESSAKPLPGQVGTAQKAHQRAASTGSNKGTSSADAAAADDSDRRSENSMDAVAGVLVVGALEAASANIPYDLGVDAGLPTMRVGEGGRLICIDRLPSEPLLADMTEHLQGLGAKSIPVPQQSTEQAEDGLRPSLSRTGSILDPSFFRPPTPGKGAKAALPKGKEEPPRAGE